MQPFDFHALLKRVAAVNKKFSFGGFEDAHQQAEKSRFAGAIGTKQSADLAGRDRKGDVFQGNFIAEGLGYIVDCDQTGARWLQGRLGGSPRNRPIQRELVISHAS